MRATAGAWMRANLTAQGYCLSDAEHRRLASGCGSPPVIRSTTSWNHGVRHLFGAPVLPANPRRRRYAFKVATVWLVLVGALFAAGAATAELVLGGMLVAACALVTATNLCLPSETFAWLERRRTAGGTTTITTRGDPA